MGSKTVLILLALVSCVGCRTGAGCWIGARRVPDECWTIRHSHLHPTPCVRHPERATFVEFTRNYFYCSVYTGTYGYCNAHMAIVVFTLVPMAIIVFKILLLQCLHWLLWHGADTTVMTPKAGFRRILLLSEDRTPACRSVRFKHNTVKRFFLSNIF